MFISIKTLKSFMDDNIEFVKDAMVNHSNVTQEEYKEYLINMQRKLNAQLNELKRKSCNKKLIVKYEELVQKLFEGQII